MYIINPAVAVTEVGKGRALAYIKGSDSAITLNQVEYWLYLEIEAKKFSSPEALAVKTDSSLTSVIEAISRLKEESILLDSQAVPPQKQP